MIKSQRGITLVELLATLALLSFIGIIIWGVFFQGVSFSQKSSTKNALQQEANFVITSLTKIHQTSDHYQISSDENKITVIFSINNTTQSQDFSDSRFNITGKFVDNDTGEVVSQTNSAVVPNDDNISFVITISDKNNSQNQVTENGILYRLKGGGV